MGRTSLIIFAVLVVARLFGATVETRNGASLEGSLSFEPAAVVVQDVADKATIVPMKEVSRITFFARPKTFTLTNIPWSSADIGEVLMAGSTAFTNAALVLTASGWGLWRDTDGLRFASVPLNGDGEIIARVADFNDANGTVLAGISVRENPEPRARHISLLQSSKGTLTFRARDDDGFVRRTLPIERTNSWLRLTRSGSRLTAYVSDDAKNWLPIEGAVISASNILRVGVFVSTEVNAALGTASFRDITIQEGTTSKVQTDLPAPAIVLRDGTVLAGEIIATNETVQFSRAGLTRQFNISALAAILFRPVAAEIVLQPNVSAKTGVVMNDRDWLEGEVRAFTPHGVVIGTLLFGAKTVRWSERPAAIVLGGRTESGDWNLIFKDGSQVRAGDFSIQGNSGTARTSTIGVLPFMISELREVRAVRP